MKSSLETTANTGSPVWAIPAKRHVSFVKPVPREEARANHDEQPVYGIRFGRAMLIDRSSDGTLRSAALTHDPFLYSIEQVGKRHGSTGAEDQVDGLACGEGFLLTAEEHDLFIFSKSGLDIVGVGGNRFGEFSAVEHCDIRAFSARESDMRGVTDESHPRDPWPPVAVRQTVDASLHGRGVRIRDQGDEFRWPSGELRRDDRSSALRIGEIDVLEPFKGPLHNHVSVDHIAGFAVRQEAFAGRERIQSAVTNDRRRLGVLVVDVVKERVDVAHFRVDRLLAGDQGPHFGPGAVGADQHAGAGGGAVREGQLMPPRREL